MKRFLFCILLCVFSSSLFAVDLSSIKIGDSKSSLIKTHGKPFKEISNGKLEYDVWLENNEIWLICFEDEKVDKEPISLDDFLNSLLDMQNYFEGLLKDFNFADILSDPSSSDSSSNSSTFSTAVSSAVSSFTLPKEQEDKVDKTLLESTEITILDSRIINKTYDPKAGYRLKVKNKGNKEISKLEIILYFYDKDGEIFFEDSRTLIDSNSYYSTPKKLKPNYSILIPESSSNYYTVSGMDLDEWDEGKIFFEVVELK